MKVFTKESLKAELRRIRSLGWIENRRRGNDGGVGNTLEDLLGIEENNLPLPNTGEWEIKGQRADSTSLLTLFHMEPSPKALRFVPRMFLPRYGWPHKKAGTRYGQEEKSFRQTISATAWTNRGFRVVVNRKLERVEISFDETRVDRVNHEDWLHTVEQQNDGLAELHPQPYWGFDDLFHKAGTKLNKTLYAIVERKKRGKTEYFHYTEFLMLENFQRDRFINAIECGDVLVDFDARTGHNHGTKFRLRQGAYPQLYTSIQRID